MKKLERIAALYFERGREVNLFAKQTNKTRAAVVYYMEAAEAVRALINQGAK